MRGLCLCLLLFFATVLSAQPAPCGSTPIMANNCGDACVICDIDGYTGTNNLQGGSVGTVPQGFCSGPNDMHYIAFIAGSTSLSIQIAVSNCTNPNGAQWESLDLGFYQSNDCQNYTAITSCREDLENGDSFIFNTTQALTIGQHYYLVMDGTFGSICDWTFSVLQGSTAVNELTTSGIITLPEETCPGLPTAVSTTGEVGASIYFWSIDGVIQPGINQNNNLSFLADGKYEICVTAANACDQAPPVCDSIRVRTPETLLLNEVLCDGECIDVNNKTFCATGLYNETVPLPNGCDSTIVLDLTILPQAQESVDVWICNDSEFLIGTTPYNMTGMYEQTILTAMDCDSIVFLDLLVIECEIIGTADEIPVVCNGTATGTLIFSVDQGEPPLQYTYTNIIDGTITGMGSTNLLINNEIPDVPAGTYQIYIQDDFGNDVVVLAEVTEPPVLESTIEASDYNGFNVSCFSDEGAPGADGTLMAVPVGGVMPYQYLWSDGQITQEAIGLTHEEYSVTITDAVGCVIENSFVMTSPTLLVPDVEFRDPTCDGFDSGEIEIIDTIGGVPGYAFSLSNDNFTEQFLFEGLFEGAHTVYVEDQNGCVVSVDGMLTAPDIPVINFGDDITIFLGDSTQLFPSLNNTSVQTITWDNIASLSCADCLEPFARPFNDATYTLTIISDDDCSDMASINISVDNSRRRVYIPSAFSPNGDGINEELIINAGIEVEQITSFYIFDRWGSRVFEAENFPPNDITYSWDGKFNGSKLNPGLFTWVAEVRFLDGEIIPYLGDITILK